MNRIKEHKYFLLLVVIVAFVVLQSIARSWIGSDVSAETALSGALVAVFFVVFTRRYDRVAALVVLLLSLAFQWSRFLVPAREPGLLLQVSHHLLVAAFIAFAVYVILRNIFDEKIVARDEVLGPVCGYILAAGLWSHLYAVVELMQPGSFSFSADLAKEVVTWQGQVAVFNYFSLITLTTVGYGDVTPLRAPATALAALEAIFGQFYIAIVVAQLVGLRLAQAVTPRDSRRKP